MRILDIVAVSLNPLGNCSDLTKLIVPLDACLVDDDDDEDWFEEPPVKKEPSLKMKRNKPAKKEPNLKMKR